MKKCLLSLTLASTLLGASAFAGTAASYRNEALGFTIIASAMDDTLLFMDQDNNELEFSSVRQDGNKWIYREKTGKCEISMEYFSQDFAEGKTKEDFMLSLGVQVVQVIKGKCELQQKMPNQKRSLTGLYL